MNNQPKIIYTFTDESPALATFSLLPIVKSFMATAGIPIEEKDISLAKRILTIFKDYLKPDQQVEDALHYLSKLVLQSNANIIKLPNISASLPQLKEAIKELQSKGFLIPNYPDNPTTAEEKDIYKRYNAIKGSAVNPVLRQGNSDRRIPAVVKNHARKNSIPLGKWSKESKTEVACMNAHDFKNNERSKTLAKDTLLTINFIAENQQSTNLKRDIQLYKGDLVDVSYMSSKHLVSFLENQVSLAKEKGLLFSLHLKATMMKVSDPIIFGHSIKVFFKPLFEKHSVILEQLGWNPNDGIGGLLEKIKTLDSTLQSEIHSTIEKCLQEGPDLSMVDSDKGISNLHVPNNVIIDASMPVVIKNSGKLWNSKGELQDTLAVIPDSSYAGVYKAVVDFCKKNGEFDPKTMGSVPNIGLMANKAEEYGSHDKTFEIPEKGIVRVIDQDGNLIFEQSVDKGAIWRMCITRSNPIKQWIELTISRVKESGLPAVFWLDKDRAHDVELIKMITATIDKKLLEDKKIQILNPYEAAYYTLERTKKGLDTISVTGNVLRDYLTDLFPILEVGTSAKMQSIVPLMNGGMLFETGAGGSAPKLVEQLLAENHLRWSSLGEFLAISASLHHFSSAHDHKKALVLAQCLDIAIEKFLSENKSPSKRVNEIDIRGSHFYICLYWSEALANQSTDVELQKIHQNLFEQLAAKEVKIIAEMNDAQGVELDLKGYFYPNKKIAIEFMRPSKVFNEIIDQL